MRSGTDQRKSRVRRLNIIFFTICIRLLYGSRRVIGLYSPSFSVSTAPTFSARFVILPPGVRACRGRAGARPQPHSGARRRAAPVPVGRDRRPAAATLPLRRDDCRQGDGRRQRVAAVPDDGRVPTPLRPAGRRGRWEGDGQAAGDHGESHDGGRRRGGGRQRRRTPVRTRQR